MLFIFVYFAVGIGLGFLLRRRQTLSRLINHLVEVCICILLFLLGASLGNNPVLMNNLGGLGLEAAVLAVGAVLGSILMVCPVNRLVFNGKRE